MRLFNIVRRILLTLTLGSLALPGSAAPVPKLQVSEDHRFLVTSSGQPFFWLGDTAWELFHRLTREEATQYLENRVRKGFTVIQCVVLAELDGLKSPNAYGHLPLMENDPTRPDVKEGPANDYWDHVDFVIAKAASLGLYVGLLPTWGDKWQSTRGGTGPVIFNVDNARVYGRWLGARYREQPIIWVLGGDRNVETSGERAIIDAMAKGLREGDGGTHLMTFHPRGPGASSEQLHHAEWLDLNMVQSSHGARDHDNGLFIAHDYALRPPKPTLDGEPRYENITVGFYLAGASKVLVFDDYDCRQAAYWALLAGACGHTYGNGNVWQMWAPGRTPVLDARIPWQEALDHPGAFQMGYMRRLFESRPFAQLIPNESFIVDGPLTGGAKVRGAVAKDGAFGILYSPRGEPFTVRLDAIKARDVQTWWFDPRYGTANPLYLANGVTLQTFVPPSSGRGQDWVLVLDDAAKKWGPPGRVKP
jgi:hypothetical protein